MVGWCLGYSCCARQLLIFISDQSPWAFQRVADLSKKREKNWGVWQKTGVFEQFHRAVMSPRLFPPERKPPEALCPLEQRSVPMIVITVYEDTQPRALCGERVRERGNWGGAWGEKKPRGAPLPPFSTLPVLQLLEHKVIQHRLGLYRTGHHAVWGVWQLGGHGCHFAPCRVRARASFRKIHLQHTGTCCY